MGEVGPGPEDYTSQEGRRELRWDSERGHRFGVQTIDASGSSASVIVNGVVADGTGAVYVTGSFSGAITLGSTALSTASDSSDAFLAKLSADGHFLWAESFAGSESGTAGVALAYDAEHDRVVLVRHNRGLCKHRGLQGRWGPGIFIGTFDSSGHPLWGMACANASGATARAVGIAKNGTITALGLFHGAVTCGSQSATSPSAKDALLVVSIAPSGNVSWVKAWGDNSGMPMDQNRGSIAVTTDGSAWIDWAMSPHVQLAPLVTLVGANGATALVKLDASGNIMSDRSYGDGAQNPYAVAVDASGNVYLAGENHGMIDFGGGTLAAVNGLDVTMASFDSTGGFLWDAQYKSDSQYSYDDGHAIAIEPSGDLMLASVIGGGIDFGDGEFRSDTAYYAALTRFTPKPPPNAPTLIWSKYYGGDKATDGDVQAHAMTLAARPQPGARSTPWSLGRTRNPRILGPARKRRPAGHPAS